jgi:hypothetical protein
MTATQTFPCSKCSRAFDKPIGLAIHMREKHGQKDRSTDCRENCGKGPFKNALAEAMHYMRAHDTDFKGLKFYSKNNPRETRTHHKATAPVKTKSSAAWREKVNLMQNILQQHGTLNLDGILPHVKQWEQNRTQLMHQMFRFVQDPLTKIERAGYGKYRYSGNRHNVGNVNASTSRLATSNDNLVFYQQRLRIKRQIIEGQFSSIQLAIQDPFEDDSTSISDDMRLQYLQYLSQLADDVSMKLNEALHLAQSPRE